MEGRFEQTRIDSIFLDVFKSLEQDVLNFFELVDFDALNTKSEGGLARRVIVACTWAELRSHLGLDH